jgi:hypothetical protein
MSPVNTVIPSSSSTQSVGSSADDMQRIAQSNTPTNTPTLRTSVRQQSGKGTLGELPRSDQTAFTRSAQVPATPPIQVRIELGDPHPARLIEWLTGGAIKTAPPENEGAREVARSAGVPFSKDGRSLNLPNNALGGQLFAQMQYTRWQRNSPHPMEWGALILKPVGTSETFVEGFKAEWARMNKQGWIDLGAEALMNLGGALAGGRRAGRFGPAAPALAQRLTPTAAVGNVRVSLAKFERTPSGTNAVELNAALTEANMLVKGRANRASLPDGLVKQYASLHTQAQRVLSNALRGADTGQPAAAASGRVSSSSLAPSELTRFERHRGESMSDYLARQNVPQSLTPEQQRSADKHRMRMSATPPPSGPSSRRPIDAISMAIKMKNFNNTASAIANPRTFDTLLNQFDKQPISTVVRIGNTGPTQLEAKGLMGRTDAYRGAGIHKLSRDVGSFFSPQMSQGSGSPSHEAHTAFGAVSKLGEVHANSGAFSLADDSWASRSRLPGQGGKPVSEFWNADTTKDWKDADEALTSLATANPQLGRADLTTHIDVPLRDTGFIPKGSALAARLERLEAAVGKRETLQRHLNTAGAAPEPALQGQLQTAIQNVQRGLDDLANRATQSRSELLMQSLGTAKTTYELTIRHAATARYMQSIEGQAGAVFSAAKFKSLLAEVKKEAGPEAEVSRRWHRALIERYGADAEFQSAMQQSTAMRQAWAAYKAQYGH